MGGCKSEAKTGACATRRCSCSNTCANRGRWLVIRGKGLLDMIFSWMFRSLAPLYPLQSSMLPNLHIAQRVAGDLLRSVHILEALRLGGQVGRDSSRAVSYRRMVFVTFAVRKAA